MTEISEGDPWLMPINIASFDHDCSGGISFFFSSLGFFQQDSMPNAIAIFSLAMSLVCMLTSVSLRPPHFIRFDV